MLEHARLPYWPKFRVSIHSIRLPRGQKNHLPFAWMIHEYTPRDIRTCWVARLTKILNLYPLNKTPKGSKKNWSLFMWSVNTLPGYNLLSPDIIPLLLHRSFLDSSTENVRTRWVAKKIKNSGPFEPITASKRLGDAEFTTNLSVNTLPGHHRSH